MKIVFCFSAKSQQAFLYMKDEADLLSVLESSFSLEKKPICSLQQHSF